MAGGDAQISLGRGNRRDFVGGLRACGNGNGNRSDHIVNGCRESTERNDWKWGTLGGQEETAQGNLSGIYKDNPNKDF